MVHQFNSAYTINFKKNIYFNGMQFILIDTITVKLLLFYQLFMKHVLIFNYKPSIEQRIFFEMKQNMFKITQYCF